MNRYKSVKGNELYLLIILTLFKVPSSSKNNVLKIVKGITGDTTCSFNVMVQELRKMELITSSEYNWRTDSYEYTVANEAMIPLMLYFLENKKEALTKVLDAAAKTLTPAPIQRLIWEYIINDFTLVTGSVGKADIDLKIEVLLPVVGDSRFAALLQAMDRDTFFELMNVYLAKCFDEELLVDAQYLRTLVELKKLRSDEYTMRINCLIDLYAYMAYGTMPGTLLAPNKNHRIISALQQAYQGKCTQALEHIKTALSLHAKSLGYASPQSKRHLPLALTNVFYVLLTYKASTADSKRRCLTLVRSAERGFTHAASVLYNILYSEYDKGQMEWALSSLLTSHMRIDRVLAVMLCKVAGKEDILAGLDVNEDLRPRWLILRHEMRKYTPMPDKECKLADEYYGKEGLLSTIHVKKEWETVLEDLMELSQPGGTDAKEEEMGIRIAYFISRLHGEFDSVQVRQQTVLKNGKWSAGKAVSMTNFMEGMLEGMTDADRRIVGNVMKANFRWNEVCLQDILPEMAKNSRLYVGSYAPYTLVEVTEEMPYLTLVHDENGFRITSNVPKEKVEKNIIITHRGAATINFLRMNEEQRPYYRRLLSLNYFPDEAEEQLRTFLNSLGGRVEVNSELIEGGSTLPITEGSPKLVMQMRPQDKEAYMVGVFVRPLDGGGIKLSPGKGDDTIVDSGRWTDQEGNEHEGRTRVTRDLKAEKDNLKHFTANCPEVKELNKDIKNNTVALVNAYDLLPLIEYAQANPDRISCEWPEGARMRIKQRQTSTSWGGAIKKKENGWFEIEGTIELDQDKVVTMAQLLDLANKSRGRFIKLGDGEFLALSEKLRKQLASLSAIASRSKGKLVMSPFSAALLGADVMQGELMLSEDKELKAIRKRIKDSSKYTPDVPANLNAKLREYQKEGYQWMARLNSWGAGALLADDMGLGKTIQSITYLLSKADEGAALVVAPASVTPNWKMEMEKFAPSLNVMMLNFAEDRNAMLRNAKAGDVVITTYGLLLSVKDVITEKQWTSVCLDEAHIIKNRGAKTSAVAMKLKSQYRIMLTGTPVQNHLGELWNLFQFVNPGLLGGFEDFNHRFIIPIEQDGDKSVQRQLDRIVKPFMLRRTKDKVAKELPEKEEIYQHVDMDEEEILVYEALRQRAEAMLMAEKGGKVSMTTLAEITRLRQCACDIRLIEEGRKGNLDKQGTKINALVELLQTILDGFENGGVLVFSQFTSYLALIKQALDKENIPYLYIDGSVPIKERQRLVKKFQDGECPVFLISLKAGGLGLNLTRANYVVHMDPWWNPAIEAQATDRAHRIGQKQAVTVYHLIAEGSIEEKIQRLHEQKRELVENVLESTDMSYKLTGEELLKLVHD